MSKLWAALFLRALGTCFVLLGFLLPLPALSQDGSAARCLKLFTGLENDPTHADEVQTDDLQPSADVRNSQEIVDANTVVDDLPPISISDPVRVEQVYADQRAPVPDMPADSPTLRVQPSRIEDQNMAAEEVQPTPRGLKIDEVQTAPKTEPVKRIELAPEPSKPVSPETAKLHQKPLRHWVRGRVVSQATVEIPRVGEAGARLLNYLNEHLWPGGGGRGYSEATEITRIEYFRERQAEFDKQLKDAGLEPGVTLSQITHEYSSGIRLSFTPTKRQQAKLREMAEHALARGEHFRLSGDNIVFTKDGNDVYLIDRPNSPIEVRDGEFTFEPGQSLLTSSREAGNSADRTENPVPRTDLEKAGFYIPGLVSRTNDGLDYILFRIILRPKQGDLHSVDGLIHDLRRHTKPFGELN